MTLDFLSIIFGFLLGGGVIGAGVWLFLSGRLALARAESRANETRLEEIKGDLPQMFKALSAETIKDNSEEFLKLATAKFDKLQAGAAGDLAQRHGLIKEQLAEMNKYVRDLETKREGAYASIIEHVTALKAETQSLSRAMRSSTARGQWGEMQLRRVVELAGMVEHVNFSTQKNYNTETGKQKPDLTVFLPGGQHIFVDSKVPIETFLRALDNDDLADRKLAMEEHAKLVRGHMKKLGRKSYWDLEQGSPEFVVMFLPSEHLFSAALQQDPLLVDAGIDNNVIIATPTTLIALLRAVSYGWRQESLAENSRKISDLGGELYKRLASMGKHFDKLGLNLGRTVDAYNGAMGALDSRVLVTARKLHDLKAANIADEVNPAKIIEKTPRSLTAPEFNEIEKDEVIEDLTEETSEVG